jgi:hypothetical protein
VRRPFQPLAGSRPFFGCADLHQHGLSPAIAPSIKAAFCCLKGFRRIATRYGKLAVNFLSAVVLAAIIAFWI